MSSYAGIISTLVGTAINAITGTGFVFFLSLGITSLTGWWFAGAVAVVTGAIQFGATKVMQILAESMREEEDAETAAAAESLAANA